MTAHKEPLPAEEVATVDCIIERQFGLKRPQGPVLEEPPTQPRVPAHPSLHQGPRAIAAPDEDQMFETFMRLHFPADGA